MEVTATLFWSREAKEARRTSTLLKVSPVKKTKGCHRKFAFPRGNLPQQNIS